MEVPWEETLRSREASGGSLAPEGKWAARMPAAKAHEAKAVEMEETKDALDRLYLDQNIHKYMP